MRVHIHLIFTSILFLTSTCSYSASFGDLLISEVMSNPGQVSDATGEWFEIFNTSSSNIDLNGLTISDDGSNNHVIDNGGSLLINPGGYLVLGRNGDININGGYFADYVYDNFTLGNSNDQIIITNETAVITRLDYSGANFGVAGTSAELILQTTNPSSADYQLTQGVTYGLGDLGTPGSQGSVELIYTTPVPVPAAIWFFLSGLALLIRKQIFSLEICNQINPVRKDFTR